MCERACVTEEPAIRILPRNYVLGKAGNHYVKGWEKDDEKRLNDKDDKEQINSNKARDYLNDGDLL